MRGHFLSYLFDNGINRIAGDASAALSDSCAPKADSGESSFL
jgi:hypothetical protein